MSVSRTVGEPRQGGIDAHSQFLERLDAQKLTSFHWKATIVAGMGFLTDSYDLFVIGTVLLLIGKDPTMGKGSFFAGNLAGNDALIGSSALIAAFLGALIFGTIADRVGRRVIYGVELLVLALGAIASAFAPDLTWLIIFRFILGIGIGGDYPVSATIISEHSNRSDRGKLIGTVFAMQAVGIVAGYALALVVLGLGTPPGIAWRVLLGLGALPALATFWMRRQMPESPRFLLHVRHDPEAARNAVSQESTFLNAHEPPAERTAQANAAVVPEQVAPSKRAKQPFSWRILFSSPRFIVYLIGTAGAWFLMDYAYYGTTISSPIVIQRILGKGATSFQTTLAGFLIVLVAAVPGYIIAILTLDKIGRKRIQMLGFAMMALAYGAIALIPAVRNAIWAFAIAFAVSYFFVEFGPNTTTFLYPAEIYPTATRTTAHGISAGFAKIGAFVGVLLFPILEGVNGNGGKNIALAIGAAGITAVLGFFVTMLLPEPNQRSLEISEQFVTKQAILERKQELASEASA